MRKSKFFFQQQEAGKRGCQNVSLFGGEKKSFEIAFLKVKSYARCTEGIQKGEQETAEIYGTLIRREYIRADKVGLRFTRMDKF